MATVEGAATAALKSAMALSRDSAVSEAARAAARSARRVGCTTGWSLRRFASGAASTDEWRGGAGAGRDEAPPIPENEEDANEEDEATPPPNADTGGTRPRSRSTSRGREDGNDGDTPSGTTAGTPVADDTGGMAHEPAAAGEGL